MLSVTPTVSDEGVVFTEFYEPAILPAVTDLYLRVSGGALSYSETSDGTFQAVLDGNGNPYQVTGSSIIQFDSIGTLYLVGMDTGGGQFTNSPSVGSGTIVVQGGLVTGGQPLTLTSDTITVGTGVTVNTGSTSAAAGDLTFSAEVISIGDGASLLAEAPSGMAAGDIVLTAADTTSLDGLSNFFDFLTTVLPFEVSHTATIALGSGVTVAGGSFSATATAGEVNPLQELLGNGLAYQFVNGDVVNNIENVLITNFLAQPISVVVREASAAVTIGASSSIVTSGDVELATTANADAVGEAAYQYASFFGLGGFAVGVAVASSSAVTSVAEDVTITSSGGDVSVTSSGSSTTDMTAQVYQNTGASPTNPNNIQVSVGLTDLTTTSQATVATGATIAAPSGNVTVQATGENDNSLTVNSASYRDGYVGLTAAVAFTTSTVQASVDGTITAGSRSTGSQQTFNPFLTVDFATSALVFATSPGYSTGQPLVYDSGTGGPIPGLEPGETYYAIVGSDPTRVQLALTQDDATNGVAISFSPAYPTLAGIPFSNVDAVDDWIVFDFDPGFAAGQSVAYAPASGNYLGFNSAGGSLLGPLPAGTYTIQFATDPPNTEQTFVQLVDSTGAVVDLNDNPVFTIPATDGNPAITLEVFSFDGSGNYVTFFPDSLPASLALTNGQALTYTQGIATFVPGLVDGQTYYAIVDPTLPGYVVQLAATAQDAAAANPAVQAAYPTFTWTDANNGAQVLQLAGVDSLSDDTPTLDTFVFTTALTIPDGTPVAYQAVPGKPLPGLVDGDTYYAFNATNPFFDPENPQYLLNLRSSATATANITVTPSWTLTAADGAVYTIAAVDAEHQVLTIISADGTNPAVATGDALTFSDSLGNTIGSLIDGQTYYAIVAPTQPYDGALILALDLAQADAMSAAPTPLSFQGAIRLGPLGISYMSGTQHTLTPLTAAGITVSAVLTSKDEAKAKSQEGSEPKLKNLLNGTMDWNSSNWSSVWQNISNSPALKNGDSPLATQIQTAADGKTNTSFNLSGSFLLLNVSNTVTAEVGSNAILTATEDISVSASITESTQTSDEATVSKPSGTSSSTAIAGAALIGLYDNSSTATVDANARIDAGNALSVSSTIEYPWAGQLAFPTLLSVPENLVGTVATLTDGKLGLDDWLVNSWSNAGIKAGQTKTTIAGSLKFVRFANTNVARIGVGAQVNQTEALQNPQQTVSVTAQTDTSQVHFSGQVYLDFSLDNLQKVRRRNGITATSFNNQLAVVNQGAQDSLGGSLAYVSMENTTTAVVGDTEASDPTPTAATAINFGEATDGPAFVVEANQQMFQLELGQAGGQAQGLVVDGTVSVANIDTSTTARIASGVVVTSNTGSTGDVSVQADDSLVLISLAGAVLISGNRDVGISGILTNVSRDVVALVGDPDTTPGSSTYSIGGDLDVQATATGGVYGFALAGTSATSGPPANAGNGVGNALSGANVNGNPAPAQANQDVGGLGADPPASNTGFGFSGDAAVLTASGTTSASINDSGTFDIGGALTVAASDDTVVVSVSGAATFAGSANAASTGIAGSLSIVWIDGSVDASIDGGAQVTTSSLDFTATRGHVITSLAAGGTGASSNTGSTAVAGSVAFTVLDNDTSATVGTATVALGSDSQIQATDSSVVVAVGGALASGGKSGYGFGASVNILSNTTEASATDASITQSNGGLSLEAENSSVVVSIAAGLATSSQGVAAAGMFGVNIIDNTTTAAMTNGSYTNTSTGDLALTVTDQPIVVSVTGDVASGTNKGIGGAVSYGQISNTNDASISGTTVATGGGVLVTSESSAPPGGVAGNPNVALTSGADHAIWSVAIGGAGSGNLALAGSVAVNELTTTSDATIGNAATVNAAGTIAVSATDAADIWTAGGGVGISDSLAIGAAIARNNMSNSTSASVEGAIVESTGGAIQVTATESSAIRSLAVGGTGADTSALGGSVAVNSLTNDATASVSGATLGSVGDTSITATDDSTIEALGGALNLGQTSVGAAFVWNNVTGTTAATVQDSTLVTTPGAAGDILVQSSSTPDVTAIAVGGGGGAGTAVSGSVVVDVLTLTTTAGITGTAPVTADGTVVVAAAEALDVFAGAGTGNGSTGGVTVGLGNATLTTTATTTASIGDGAVVRGGGAGNGYSPPSGTLGSSDPLTGVVVLATAASDLKNVAVGGVSAGGAGVAGSATVQVLSGTTTATISGSADVASASGDVAILATDQTEVVSGTLDGAVSGATGVGAGVDVGVVNKATTAAITATSSGAGSQGVSSGADVIVQALSQEDIVSVSVAGAIGESTGIAGTVSVYTLNVATEATIGESATVSADGNVLVAADDQNSIVMVDGAGTSGSLAIGASVGVPVVVKTTTASIAANATVDALGNGAALTVNDGSYTTTTSSSGAPPDYPTPWSQFDATAVGEPTLTGPSQIFPNTVEASGVIVTATSSDDIDLWSIAGAVGEGAVIPIAVTVHVANVTTQAFIDSGASVNTADGGSADQSVFVAAGTNFAHVGVAGSGGAGGGAAVGPGIDVPVVTLTTTASINDGATVSAKNDVAVVALAEERIDSVAIGAAGGSAWAVGGSVSVIAIDTTTTASIGGNDGGGTPAVTTVVAQNNVLVEAQDDTTVFALDGALGLGFGSVGAGASVAVIHIEKDTEAFIGQNAVVDGLATGTDKVNVLNGTTTTPFPTEAVQGVAVQATSSEDVRTILVTGAAGTDAGIAGSVAVTTVRASTAAYVGGATINGSGSPAGDSQSVRIGAANATTIDNDIPTDLGAGTGGLAGAVNVGRVFNQTQAFIDDAATVNASGEVDVFALSNKDFETFALSLGGGIGGIAASVAVYTLGTVLDADAQAALTAGDGSGSIGQTASTAAQLAPVVGALGGFQTLPNTGSPVATSGSTQTSGNSGAVQSNVATAITAITDSAGSNASGSLLSQSVAPASGVAATVSGGATVTAGGNVSVQALENVSVDLDAGNITAGLGAIGAAVIHLDVNSNTLATVDAGVDTQGSLLVSAELIEQASATAIAGSVGLGAVSGQYVEINDTSTQTASLGANAQVSEATSITVSASAARTISADASEPVTIGLGVTGVSNAIVNASGSTEAIVADGAAVGQVAGQTVGSLDVAAVDTSTATTTMFALPIGLLTVPFNGASTTLTPNVTAAIQGGTAVTTSGSVTIAASATPQAVSEGEGIDVGGLTVGGASAIATASPTVTASLGTASGGVTVHAGSVSVTATVAVPSNASTASATATAPFGSIVGLNASNAEATTTSQATATIADGTTLAVGGTVQVSAANTTSQEASASGDGGAGVAVGVNTAAASSTNTTSATVGNGVTITAGALSVQATGSDTNNASSNAGDGGLLVVNSNSADTTTSSTTTASIGGTGDATVVTVGELTLAANQTQTFNGQSDSSYGGVAGSSGADASNTATSTVSATVGGNVSATGKDEGITIQAGTTIDKPALANGASHVQSGSGGVVDEPSGTSTTTVTADTNVTVADGASLAASGTSGTLVFEATNALDLVDTATVVAGGYEPIVSASSEVTPTTTAEVSIGKASLTSTGTMAIAAQTDAAVAANATAKAWGATGGPSGSSSANLTATNTVQIGDGATLQAGGDLSLLAGENASGSNGAFTVAATTDIFDGTAFGFGLLSADGVLAQTTAVILNAGSMVQSNGNINLVAEEGSVNVTGNGQYSAWDFDPSSPNEGTPSGNSLPYPSTITGGTFTYTPQVGVTVDGTVQVGGQSAVSVVFDEQLRVPSGDATAGDAVTTRGSTDSDVGQVYVNTDTFSGIDAPAWFAWYATNTTNHVTPLLFEVTTDGYVLAAVGQSVLAGQIGPNVAALALIQGEVDPAATYVFGYSDQQVAAGVGAVVTSLTSTGGTIPFDFDATGDWLYTTGAAAQPLVLGGGFATVGGNGATVLNSGRAYSALVPLASAAVYVDAAGNATIFPAVNVTASPALAGLTLTTENLTQTIGQQIQNLAALQTQYVNSPQALAGYQAQIDALRVQLQQLLGLPQPPTIIPNVELPVGVLTLPNITAGVGNVNVSGSYFVGTGAVVSPADAGISVTNNSPYSLVVQDLSIPVGTGGQIIFNDVPVSTVAQVNQLNQDAPSGTSAAFATFETSGTSTPPSITVQNTFDPADGFSPGVNVGLNIDQFLAPALTIEGSVTVRAGSFTADNPGGTIEVTGSIVAAAVDIEAGGNFTVSSSGLYSVGGDPSQQWAGQASSDDAEALVNSSWSNSVAGSVPPGTATGTVLADGDVFITAQYLNINGLVQSGRPDRATTITDEAIGSPLVANPFTDTFEGQVYINGTSFVAAAAPPLFGFYANVTGHFVTPLLFAVNANGSYALAAVGQSIAVQQTGLNFAPFTIIQGGVVPGATYVFGYADQQVSAGVDGAVETVQSFLGTIAGVLVDPAGNGPWMGAAVGPDSPIALSLGQTYSPGGGVPGSIPVWGNRVYGAFLPTAGVLTPTNPSAVVTQASSYFQSYYEAMQAIGTTPPFSYVLSTDTGANNGIDATYNPVTNQVDVESVQVRGGFVQLTGQLLSTGNGSIQAVDGFGSISITNQTGYDLALEDLDTGGQSGLEGRIVLVDTTSAGRDSLGRAVIPTTTYTRDATTDAVVVTTTAQIVGSPAIPRADTNDGIGAISLNTEAFTLDVLPTSVSFYSTAVGQAITPVFYEVGSGVATIGNGMYTLAAVGQSIPVTTAGVTTAPLVIASGNLSTGGVYAFGFAEQLVNSGVTPYSGTVPFDEVLVGNWLTSFSPSTPSITPGSSTLFVNLGMTFSAFLFLEDQASVSVSTASFQPTPNQRFFWTTGQSTVSTTTNTWITTTSANVFDKIVGDSDVNTSEPPSSTFTTPTSTVALLQGGYVGAASSPNYPGYLFATQLTDTGTATTSWQPPVTLSTSTTWYDTTTVTISQSEVIQQGQSIVNTHSVAADWPIAIGFLGSKQGTVTVASPGGSVVLGGTVTNAGGATTITSGGAVNMMAAAPIQSGALQVTAQTGIGTDGTIETDLAGGTVNASTATGSVVLTETGGDLVIGGVSTGDGNVTLTAYGNLLGATEDALVQGGMVSLTSTAGGIGTSAMPLAVATGDTPFVDGLVIAAASDINVIQPQGDMLLTSAVSKGGNVVLTATNGSIVDNQSTIPRDTRPLSQLQALWNSLALFGDAAQQAANNAVTALENQVERQYRTYWLDYRLTGYDASGEPEFSESLGTDYQFTFSQQQQQVLMQQGYTASQISAWEVRKTQEAIQLDGQFGGTTYDPDYTYTATAAQVASLTAGAVWNEEQLQFPIPLAAFAVPSGDEGLNISGVDITLNASGSVGVTDGQIVLDFSEGAPTLTAGQQQALASADIGDLSVVDSTIALDLVEDLDIEARGVLTISAGGSVYVGSPIALQLGQIAASQDVEIVSNTDIVNAAAAGTVNVTASSMTLIAVGGAIGSDASPVTVTLTNGALTAEAATDISIEAPTGNLEVNSITAGGTVQLTAPNGSVTTSPPVTAARSRAFALAFASQPVTTQAPASTGIRAARLAVTAGSGVGSADNPLQTQVDFLSGDAGSSDFHLGNAAPVSVTGFRNHAGLRAAGAVAVTANGHVQVAGQIAAGQSVAVTVPDTASPDDHLTIASGAAVTSEEGSVALSAGDNLTVANGATVRASIRNPATSVSLSGAPSNADVGIGAQHALLGLISGHQVHHQGGSDGDTITVGPNQLNAHHPDGVFTVHGGGAGKLVVDDAADTAAHLGRLTASTVTGLGQSIIRYLGFREVVVLLGSGDDAFHVQDIPDFLVVTISGGAGNDRFTLDRSQRVSIDGGEGSDSLAILGRAAHGWVISGINTGSVRQLKTTRRLDFEGMERLVGGRGRDVFTLNRGARLTGRVHGGGGIDELVIPRDARVRALGQSLRRIVTEGLVTDFASTERLKRSPGSKPLRA